MATAQAANRQGQGLRVCGGLRLRGFASYKYSQGYRQGLGLIVLGASTVGGLLGVVG